MSSPPEVTQRLIADRRGQPAALDELVPVVYAELRRLAEWYMRGERPDHTLQATALVHEAYLRLIDQTRAGWQDRAHFLGIAARLMRQILVNYAQKHAAVKRGGQAYKLSLDEALGPAAEKSVDLVALDQALERLAAIDPQKSRIVEMRFFAGLSIEETAEALGVSPRTVKRSWRLARAWLHGEISRGETS